MFCTSPFCLHMSFFLPTCTVVLLLFLLATSFFVCNLHLGVSVCDMWRKRHIYGSQRSAIAALSFRASPQSFPRTHSIATLETKAQRTPNSVSDTLQISHTHTHTRHWSAVIVLFLETIIIIFTLLLSHRSVLKQNISPKVKCVKLLNFNKDLIIIIFYHQTSF